MPSPPRISVCSSALLFPLLFIACSASPSPYPTEPPLISPAPLPTRTPDPTITSTLTITAFPPTITPTPTFPSMYDGPLPDARQCTAFAEPEITLDNKRNFDLNVFELAFGLHRDCIALVRQRVLPGSNIREYVWGFNLRGEAHFFKTLSVTCRFTQTSGYHFLLGDRAEGAETGVNYPVGFVGLIQPPPVYSQITTMSPDCQQVWSNMQGDPQIPDRISRYLNYGDSSPFQLDHQGIVDFTTLIITGGIYGLDLAASATPSPTPSASPSPRSVPP